LLDRYFELFVGGNFMRKGDNIQLNRVGNVTIVNAYLPELAPCPKPPVLPPIAADVKFVQEPLPNCPPPICAPPANPTPFPRTSTPPAGCNTEATSGGAGVTTNEWNFAPWSGTVSIDYDMYTQPDKITVYLDGVVVGTSNSPVSGTGKLTFAYPGKGVIRVVVEGDLGTVWRYSINCI
jgi:hypothetical protein